MGVVAAAALAAIKAAAKKSGQAISANAAEQKRDAENNRNKIESTFVDSTNAKESVPTESESTNGSSVDVGPSLGESLASGLKNVQVDSNAPSSSNAASSAAASPEVASAASSAAPEVAKEAAASGALTSDARCKKLKPISKVPGKEDTIKEEAAHAKKHFNTMLNNTPDADPSNGLEKHSLSEKETKAYFDGDDDRLSDEQLDAVKNWKSDETEEERAARFAQGEELSDEEVDEELGKRDWQRSKYTKVIHNIPDPEGDPLAPAKEETKPEEKTNKDGLGKTVRDAVVAKHVLKGPNLSAGPDSTSGKAEVTQFSRDGVAGSKVLLSDKNEKDVKTESESKADSIKSSLKEAGTKRLKNAGANLTKNKTQNPQVSFNNNYSTNMDYDLVSDERLKELFGDDDISCLSKIHSYDFTYKPEAQERLGDKNLGVDDLEHHGVIAQELETNPAFKGVVTEMPDGTKALKTKELTAANTAGIGDLARAIETIVGRLDNIEHVLGDRD